MKSAFKRIQRHLQTRGAECPVEGAVKEDLETLLRRWEQVGDKSVELSPYMQSLLRVSGVRGFELCR